MWQGTNSRNIINRINILKVDICSLLGFCLLFWLKMPFFFFFFCLFALWKSASFIGWRVQSTACLNQLYEAADVLSESCYTSAIVGIGSESITYSLSVTKPFQLHQELKPTPTWSQTWFCCLPVCFHILYDPAHVWTSDPMKTGCRLSIAFLVMCLNLPHVGRCTSVAVKFTFSILCYIVCLAYGRLLI